MVKKYKKRWCWRIWPFRRDNHAWIPAHLAQMERKGWRLERIAEPLSMARYEKVEPQETPYEVSLFCSKDYDQIDTYLNFCEEAGWETVWQLQECKILRWEGKGDPLPLETDEEIQAEKVEQFTRKRRNGSTAMALTLFILACIFLNIFGSLNFYIGPWGLQGLGLFVILCAAGSLLQTCWCWKNWLMALYAKKENRLWTPMGSQGWGWSTCLINRGIELFLFAGIYLGFVVMAMQQEQRVESISLLAPFIGALLGSAMRHHGQVRRRKEDGLKLTGMYLEKQSAVIYGLLLFCMVVGIFLPAPFKAKLNQSNFYFSEIQYNSDYGIGILHGDTSFTARDSKMAHKLQKLLDQEIQQPYGEYLGAAERWDEQTAQQRGYYGYEAAYYYKYSYERVMLRKGNTIYLTRWPVKE